MDGGDSVGLISSAALAPDRAITTTRRIVNGNIEASIGTFPSLEESNESYFFAPEELLCILTLL
jgi:hypothetical protein